VLNREKDLEMLGVKHTFNAENPKPGRGKKHNG